MCRRPKPQGIVLRYQTLSSFIPLIFIQFFINFNQAAAVFTAYTFATLLPYTIRAQDDLDVQHVVILALYVQQTFGYDADANEFLAYVRSALFCVFTISLFLSHMRLLYLSETTVESMRDRSILDREEHVMSGALGLCDLSYVLSCNHVVQRR